MAEALPPLPLGEPHSWGDYNLIIKGGDDDGGGHGGQAHKENIESKHFKIYLNSFSC
jgi:hypothetical protein